jgi:putative Mg2+ transporter-C (MgtC) family protein
MLTTVLPQAAWTVQVSIALEVLLAVLLGGVVGWERRKADKPAGTRTHALVAGAAALVTGVSAAAVAAFGTGDPTRGIHAVITGIGFLGAGAIIQPREGSPTLSGLTTAASVFYTACIGVAVAAGFALTAAIATLVSLAILRILGRWQHRHESEHPAPPSM